MSKLKLRGVTLAAIDTVAHDLTQKALEDCLKYAEFDEVVILSDKEIPIAGARQEFCNRFDKPEEACRALWYVLPQLVDSKHFLYIQWDSWITNPNGWDDEFLKYDYIGAPWWYRDQYNVGNGGFSLRSKKLMDFVSSGGIRFQMNEDDALCRHYRAYLEREGFKWPSNEMAYKFAFERTHPPDRHMCFGFHGLFNWPFVLSKQDIDRRLENAPEYVTKSFAYHELRCAVGEKEEV